MLLQILLAAQGQEAEDPEFNVFLSTLLFVGMGIVIVISIVSAVLILAVAGIAAILVFCGILSISVFTGLLQRSWSAGVKALLFCICILSGIVGGIPLMYIISKLFNLQLGGYEAGLVGAMGGALGGLAIAFVLLVVVRYFRKRVSRSMVK